MQRRNYRNWKWQIHWCLLAINVNGEYAKQWAPKVSQTQTRTETNVKSSRNTDLTYTLTQKKNQTYAHRYSWSITPTHVAIYKQTNKRDTESQRERCGRAWERRGERGRDGGWEGALWRLRVTSALEYFADDAKCWPKTTTTRGSKDYDYYERKSITKTTMRHASVIAFNYYCACCCCCSVLLLLHDVVVVVRIGHSWPDCCPCMYICVYVCIRVLSLESMCVRSLFKKPQQQFRAAEL